MALREKVPRGREMFLLVHLCKCTHVRALGLHVSLRVQSFRM